MLVTITAAGVSAVVAILAALAAFHLWITRAIVRAENSDLLLRINGTYVRSAGSTMTGAEIERDLVGLRTMRTAR